MKQKQKLLSETAPTSMLRPMRMTDSSTGLRVYNGQQLRIGVSLMMTFGDAVINRGSYDLAPNQAIDMDPGPFDDTHMYWLSIFSVSLGKYMGGVNKKWIQFDSSGLEILVAETWYSYALQFDSPQDRSDENATMTAALRDADNIEPYAQFISDQGIHFIYTAAIRIAAQSEHPWRLGCVHIRKDSYSIHASF
jgi:hypothetical protein